jgi:hypothetical protein
MHELIEQAKTWCVGKQWWWRVPLLLWFLFELKVNLQNPSSSIFHLLNLPIHEIGHVIFNYTGVMFLAIAGGTILQLVAPMFGMWNFWKQQDFFAMALCLGWLSTNLFGVAVYMADARTMQLNLVSLSSGDTIHDWNYIFSHMGLLPYDHLISGFVWLLALLSMLTCYVVGGWLIWQMIKQPKT